MLGLVDVLCSNYLCRLHKSLYELKQAPHAWFYELKNFILTLSFINSKYLFVYITDKPIIVYVVIYVDDLLITKNTKLYIRDVITTLSRRSSIKVFAISTTYWELKLYLLLKASFSHNMIIFEIYLSTSRWKDYKR